MTRKPHFIILVAVIAVLTDMLSCSSPVLERQQVPLLAGISLSEGCQVVDLVRNLTGYQKYGLEGWVVEIPFSFETGGSPSGFRYYEAHAVDTLIPLIESGKMPWSLMFSLENPGALEVADIDPATYFVDISGILLRSAHYLPQHIIFNGVWTQDSLWLATLYGFIESLHRDFPAFKGKIVFVYDPGSPDAPMDWQTPDIIGIRYDPPPDPGYKAYFRRVNQGLSDSLLKYDKPGMIVQTNLLGEEKESLFKNQLRFWDEGVVLVGISLNSLYCRMSLVDSTSRFSLAEEEDLLEYLQSYTHE